MIDVISLALSKNYTDKEITKAATSLSFKQKIVESLPSSGEIHTIYFVKNNSSWKNNYYDEYLWIPDTNNFEKIGSTEIPAALPNPNALTFTGGVNASYDGSSEVSVEIPDAYGATETVIFSLDSVTFVDNEDGNTEASIDMPMPFTEAGIYKVKIGNRSGIAGILQKDIDDWNDIYKEYGEYIDIDLWDIFRDEKNLNESFPDGFYYNNTTLTLYDDSIEAGEYPVSITKVDAYPSIKMDKVNPTAIGSFSLNRKPGSAIGNYSHAEGQLTTASGTTSHAEGANTTASASCSHAEGSNTIASGPAAHAEGYITTASGRNSHAEGQVTTAKSENQHVQGKYNIEDSSGVYADIIGNGIASKRSNAATVDWHGNAWFAGDVYVGSTSGTNKDEGSKKLATEEYVDNSTANIEIPQSDWNQNDETAPDYVKNRPFYTGDPVETVLVEEITVPFSDSGDGLYMGQIESTFSVKVGETYKVSWDGSTYECTCVDIGVALALGNLSIAGAGSDTGEPFVIGYENEMVFAVAADTLASHTISIRGFVTEIVKIDRKYLPIPFKPKGESYLTFSSSNKFTLSVKNAIKNWNGTLEYFDSNETWTVWNGTSELSAITNGGEYVLYLRGTRNTIITGNNDGDRWYLNGADIKCIGNIENLLDYATVESGAHPDMSDHCYSYIFQDCTALIEAPSLPATTLADSCYTSMFQGCTALIKAPSLPATTLADNCYADMFQGCTALIKAPSLPATTLANYCYIGMFYNCTSLTQAPSLPATRLADSCYTSMFYNCTSLTQAPSLPATTLAYHCYTNMFYNCRSLTQAPSLPATTLADSCYADMFYNCRSLTQVPNLPATTLADSCYLRMFLECSSLKLSSTKTDEYTQEYRIPSSGSGITASKALTGMFAATGGTFTGIPEINTTYYLSSNNMIVRETDIATLNGYVGSMINTALNAIGVAEEGAY